jgi:hypothetical protein
LDSQVEIERSETFLKELFNFLKMNKRIPNLIKMFDQSKPYFTKSLVDASFQIKIENLKPDLRFPKISFALGKRGLGEIELDNMFDELLKIEESGIIVDIPQLFKMIMNAMLLHKPQILSTVKILTPLFREFDGMEPLLNIFTNLLRNSHTMV